MTNFGVRVYDGHPPPRPGESTRDAAVRFGRERAAENGLRPIGEPTIERINDPGYGGPGWLVHWDEAAEGG